MRGFNFDISSWFGGSGSNNTFGSLNLSDYASIKNGSYGKLVKSYYAEQKKSVSSDKKSSTDKTDKIQKDKIKKENTVDTTGLSQMKKEADGLKTAVDAFNKENLWKQSNGEYDMNIIADKVKSFVNEYNDVISQSGKVNSKDIAQSVHYMKNMTTTMSKALSKVGVTVGTDGKMTVDEEALKKADVNSIKSLFVGSASYGSQTADSASEISKEAVMNSSVYSNNGTLSSSLSNLFNKWI